jgi:hypothetical protein
LGLKNTRLSVAKFPSIRIDGNEGYGLSVRPSESDWVVFRAGVDEVIYPGELLDISKLWQQGSNLDKDGLPYPTLIGPGDQPYTSWVYKTVTFQCEIVCEGISVMSVERLVPEQSTPFRGSIPR